MKYFTYIIALSCCMLPQLAAQQTSSFPLRSIEFCQDEQQQQRLLERIASQDVIGEDLIVGFPNPNEIREISGPLTVYGDIIVANNGELRITGTELNINGDIILVQNGKLNVTSSTLTFESQYLYHRSILMMNKSSFYLNASTISLGGFNVSSGLTDTTIFRFDNGSIEGGTLTSSVASSATFRSFNSQRLGEILFFDNATGIFQACTGLLTWLTAPPTCDYDISYPSAQVQGAYSFPDSALKAVGMDYRVSYEQCYGLLWGLIHETASKVVVRNSDLLACGALFDDPQPIQVTNLVNGVTHASFQYPAADRNVSFQNSRITTWNLYPRAQSQVIVQNCIFGEILCFANARAQVVNSICDGSGGYVGTLEQSSIIASQCQFLPDVIAKDASQIFTINSALPYGDVITADNAIIGLLNTQYSSYPIVDLASAVIIASIDEPSRGNTGELLPVYGTVSLVRGPDFPLIIDSYWLDFGLSAIPDDRRPVKSASALEKYREKITDWNTAGLNPGMYRLYMMLRLSSDDTLSVSREVQLINAPVHTESLAEPKDFAVGEFFPNPVQSSSSTSLIIKASLGNRDVSISMYDLSGTLRHTEELAFVGEDGVFSFTPASLPPGSYYCIIRSGTQSPVMRTVQVLPN
jgi:hypothetical protein